MANGHYTVWLKVVDNNGAEDTSSADVNVLDHAPTASFTWTPATPNEGTAVSFTDTSTSSQDTIVSWSWNFGDGGTSTLQNPTHIYDDNSEYTVTLTVTDSDSSTSAKTVMITVSNIAPTVGTFAGATINEGSTYTVSGSFTDPGADTWTATVDYGDGNGAQPLTLSGKTFSLSHTYADNGVYTVIVKVFDDDEGVGMDTVTIKVNNVALRITSMTCPLDPVKVGTSVTFTVGWMDPGLMDTQTIVWYWGDGSSSIVNAGVGSGSSTTQHTYLSSGVYTVS